MKDSAYKISLDIHEHASQAVLKAKKTDTGRKLHITLRAGGTPYTIEDDCHAAFKATKSDGTILFNACTIENKEIIYEFTEQTCTAVGRCRCEIALYGPDDKLITSPRFALLVDGTIYPDELVESTDEFSALTKLITDANGLVDEVKGKLENGEFNGEDGTSIFAVTDSEFAQIEEYRLFHTGDVYIITDGARCGNVYYADTQESAQLQGNIRGKAGERANQIHCYTTEEYQRDLPGYLIPGDVYIITEGDLRGNIYVATADDHSELKGNISGADGISPTATVEETEEGAKITITDKNGTTEVIVKNGDGGTVKSVNGILPDENGNVEIETGGGGVTTPISLADVDFASSKNLYNKATNTAGIVINSVGVETANAGYDTSDYIYLPAGDYSVSMVDATIPHFTFVSIYDLSKQFVSRQPCNQSALSISTDCYVRLSGSTARMPNGVLVKGTETPIEYIPYGLKINGSAIDPSTFSTEELLKDGSVRKEKTDFVKHSENYINHMTIERGYVISSTGVKTANNEYAITDKIYLPKNANIWGRGIQRLVYYDASGNFLKASTALHESSTTTPLELDYAIAVLKLAAAYKEEWQLVVGDVLPPFEKQYISIDGYRLHDAPDVVVDFADEFRDWNKVCIDRQPTFTLSTECEGVPKIGDEFDRTAETVIAKYDELVSAHPSYINKTSIGTASDGTTLYRYDFKLPDTADGDFSYDGQPITTKAKVILISGVHPEFGGIYGLYNAMREITENFDLDDLKRNVHFIVVPVVNPHGLNNRDRFNANGIDIARNFEVGYIAGSENSGTTPLSEPENIAIDNILQENSDALVFLSCHSFQKNLNNEKRTIWGACGTKYMVNLCSKMINKMETAWKKAHDCVPNTDDVSLGVCGIEAPHGSEGLQGRKYGIQAATLETCDYFRYDNETEPFTSFCISRNAEAYINFVRVAVGCWESTDKKLHSTLLE